MNVITILATLLAVAPATAAETILVPQSAHDLQAIVDAAQPGDTLQLEAGTWAGPLVIPAGKDGLVLQGPATLVAGGRPCTQGPRPDALLKVAARGVSVHGIRVCGDVQGPQVGILATGRDLTLDGVTVQGVPGDALMLLAPGAQVTGCTLQAAAGAAVVLALPGGDDPPICTWGGPIVHDVLDLFAGALDTLTGAAQAHAPTILAGNHISDVVIGVRVLGLAEGELVLDGNTIDAGGPALIVDPAPGSFTVLVRGPQPRAAWLVQDDAGEAYVVHARAMGFMLRYEYGTVALLGDAQVKPAVALANPMNDGAFATVKLSGFFLGDTPVDDGATDIEDGLQGHGLSGQATH